MLKSLIDGSTFSSFILIKDNECCSGLDIFNAFLENHASNKSFKKINLICYENPPDHYFPKIFNEKIIQYNYFSDPLSWNNDSNPKTDLSAFCLNSLDQTGTVFFIDSLSCAITYHKLYAVYKNLTFLRKSAMKIIILFHSDLFTLKEVEEIEFLSTTIVELHWSDYTKGVTEKTITVRNKKPSGKMVKQTEVVIIDKDLNISSKKIHEKKPDVNKSDIKKTIQSLATFKLGLEMSESEKRAKDELILPYLRTEADLGGGEIIYEADADDLEEDPDDDLDI